MKIEVLLAQLCNLVYQNNLNDFSNLELKPQFYEDLNSEHVEAYLINFGYFNTIVFRGTDTSKDWQYNLKLDPIETKWGLIHRGFYESFNLIWNTHLSDPCILNILNSRPLYITGHSFGGCLTILLALQLKELPEFNLFPMSVYTYGSPKLFISTNKEIFIPLYRYVLDGDIIPSLPLFKYKHVGKLIKLRNNKHWFSTVVNYSKYLIKLDITQLFKNHQIASYVTALSIKRNT